MDDNPTICEYWVDCGSAQHGTIPYIKVVGFDPDIIIYMDTRDEEFMQTKLVSDHITFSVLCHSIFRFYKLTVLLDVLYIDEAALGYNSWCLANYGTDRYLNVLPFYPQNFFTVAKALYTYLVVLLIKFFGKGESVRFSGKISSCLASLLQGSPAPGACPYL